MVPSPLTCWSFTGFHSMSLTLRTIGYSNGLSFPVSTYTRRRSGARRALKDAFANATLAYLSGLKLDSSLVVDGGVREEREVHAGVIHANSIAEPHNRHTDVGSVT